MEFICNESHRCLTSECKHKTPHKGQGAGCEVGIGGVSSKCYGSTPDGIISICVSVENGEYRTSKRVWCNNPKCNGGWVEYETNKITPQALELKRKEK